MSQKQHSKQPNTKINNEGFMEQKLGLIKQLSDPKAAQKKTI
jgi:hypothetical protein